MIVVDGVESEAEPAMHFGHRLPDGKVEAYDSYSVAVAGCQLYGGEVVMHMSYHLPWQAVAAEYQPHWLVSE